MQAEFSDLGIYNIDSNARGNRIHTTKTTLSFIVCFFVASTFVAAHIETLLRKPRL